MAKLHVIGYKASFIFTWCQGSAAKLIVEIQEQYWLYPKFAESVLWVQKYPKDLFNTE